MVDSSLDARSSGMMGSAFCPQDSHGSCGMDLQIHKSADRMVRSIVRENSSTLARPVGFTLPGSPAPENALQKGA